MPSTTVSIGARNGPRNADRSLAPIPAPGWCGAVGAGLGCALLVAVGLVTGWRWTVVFPAVALVPACVAAATDALTGRLPTRWVVASAAVAVPAGIVAGGPAGLAPTVTGGLVAAAPLLAVHLVAPGSLGFGDVRGAAALGLMVGAAAPDPTDAGLSGLVTVAIASGFAIIAAASSRRVRVAFGPWLVIGAVVALCRVPAWVGAA